MNKSSAVDIKPAYINSNDLVLDPKLIEKPLLERMPTPTGWRLLVLPYKGKGKTEGGVILPDKVVEENQISTQVGYVLKMGPLAYKDKTKFETGPWCQEKDWVIFARYAGSRFRIDGGEVKILNDDEILATILNPEDILH
jgi:co-chaperonin GroES (HSP10)|tara:strand:+ start:347 stop:766 length:420 start_codon:yes stop_codon:yes gene_type:complete